MLGGYMHMWACTFFPLRACVCVHVPSFPCIHVCMCVSSFPCVCVLVCVCVYVSSFPYVHVCVCVCVCVRVHVSSFPCMHVCVWCKQTETVTHWSITISSISIHNARANVDIFQNGDRAGVQRENRITVEVLKITKRRHQHNSRLMQ